jgi:hypothetical protein
VSLLSVKIIPSFKNNMGLPTYTKDELRHMCKTYGIHDGLMNLSGQKMSGFTLGCLFVKKRSNDTYTLQVIEESIFSDEKEREEYLVDNEVEEEDLVFNEATLREDQSLTTLDAKADVSVVQGVETGGELKIEAKYCFLKAQQHFFSAEKAFISTLSTTPKHLKDYITKIERLEKKWKSNHNVIFLITGIRNAKTVHIVNSNGEGSSFSVGFSGTADVCVAKIGSGKLGAGVHVSSISNCSSCVHKNVSKGVATFNVVAFKKLGFWKWCKYVYDVTSNAMVHETASKDNIGEDVGIAQWAEEPAEDEDQVSDSKIFK